MRLPETVLALTFAAAPVLADCDAEAQKFIDLSPYAGVQYGLKAGADLVAHKDRLVLATEAYFIAFDQFNAKPNQAIWAETLVNADALVTCFEPDMPTQLEAGALSVVNFNLEIDDATRADVLARARAVTEGG